MQCGQAKSSTSVKVTGASGAPIYSAPSSVTPRSTFEAAGSLADTVVLVVSADLPFAQKRFCTIEGLDNVVPLSTMRSRAFAENYGVLLVDGPLAGLCARAVVVLDADNRVVHRQLVDEIATEPDYEAALAAVTEGTARPVG